MTTTTSKRPSHRVYAVSKSGERTHPTMGIQAQSMSDAEIADIAAYLSSLAK